MEQKKVVFTIDDNIRFLQELTETNATGLFSHPYTKLLKRLHEEFGVKVQLNLFYRSETFSLARMTDRFKSEWIQNAEWLKLSFHSLYENVEPYKNSGYGEVYADCQRVQREIVRFAGEECLASTTTLHFCQATTDGLNALKACNVKGLLGLYGTQGDERTSYQTSKIENVALRNGAIVNSDGIAYAGIDIVLNCFEIDDILSRLNDLSDRKIVKVMIHEQYFYKDYRRYQQNFQEKLEKAFSFLTKKNFEGVFFEELLNESQTL